MLLKNIFDFEKPAGYRKIVKSDRFQTRNLG